MKLNLPVTGREEPVLEDDIILSTTELSGVIKSISPDFLRVSGFSEEELIGKSHNVVRHPDMPQAAFEDLWKTLKAGRSWIGMVKNRCKNGDHYWVDAFASPVYRDGRLAEYQSVRIRPDPAAVRRAEALYRRLGEGGATTPRQLRVPAFPARIRLLCLAGAAPLLASAMAGASAAWVAAALLLSAGICWSGARLLTRPLERLVERARGAIGNADRQLAEQVYTGRTDEFGTLGLALKASSAETVAVAGRMDEASRILEETTGGLIRATAQASGATRQLHEQTAMMAAGMNQMSASAREVATNAQQAADAVSGAHERARSGVRVVEETVAAINCLAEKLEGAGTVVAELESHTQTIENVVNVISEITEQTNLLALNAAIEAARAGEHGRGFAVVADEVRALATRTRESAAEIGEVVGALQQKTADAVQAMDESRRQAETGVELCGRTGQTLRAIARTVEDADRLVQQIAMAAAEQTAATEEMAGNIVSINEQADVNRRETEAAEEAGKRLARLSDDLRQLSQQFLERARGSAVAG